MEFMDQLCSCTITTILTVISILCILGYYLFKRERSGIPPGPSYLPIIGNLWETRVKYLGKRHKYCEELKKKYGNIFRIYFGSRLMIILNDFESINECFVKQKDNFSNRPSKEMWGVNEANKLGDGVIWANGHNWKSARRLSIHSLRDLGVGKSVLERKINEEADFLIEYISQYKGQLFSMHDILLKTTANIIGGVVFGQRFEYEDAELIKILGMLDRTFKSDGHFEPIHEFPFLSFIPQAATEMKFLIESLDYIMNYITNQIDQHRKTFNKENLRDFIDVVLESSLNKDETQVTEQNLKKSALDFFSAGADTTANTLEWAFLYMVLNPEIQAKCYQEIEDVIGTSRKPNYGDRTKMPYVEATLMEIQRLGNTAPFSLTHKADKDTTVQGYLIPEGSYVIANLYSCHTDAKYWEDPFEFKPERFLSEDGASVKRVPQLIPFSTGPRVCAGEILAKVELFLFFVGILQRFKMSKPKGVELSTEGWAGVALSPTHYELHADVRG